MTGTIRFYISLFLNYLLDHYDYECLVLICKLLWIYKIDKETRYILMALIRKLISPESVNKKSHGDNSTLDNSTLDNSTLDNSTLVDNSSSGKDSFGDIVLRIGNGEASKLPGKMIKSYESLLPMLATILESKFKSIPMDPLHCLMHIDGLNYSDIYALLECDHIGTPSTTNRGGRMINEIISYISKHGRPGSRKIQSVKINRLIQYLLILLKNEKSWYSQNFAYSREVNFNIYGVCLMVLSDYLLPNLHLIHVATGFYEIKKALCESSTSMPSTSMSSTSMSSTSMSAYNQILNIINSNEIDGLNNRLYKQVYQVAKVGHCYEILKECTLCMAKELGCYHIINGFVNSLTLLPHIYQHVLTTLLLQYLKENHNSDGPVVKKINMYFTEILQTRLTAEEKSSSFVIESLKTIQSIIIDAIEACRHAYGTHHPFFDLQDIHLLIHVSIENGYKHKAQLLCEQYLSQRFYTSFPPTYFSDFKNNKSPELDIYMHDNEDVIQIYETCTMLSNSNSYEEIWLSSLENYCDSVYDRLKVVKDPANHNRKMHEAETSRLTQLCGTLCAENILKLKDWSGIVCIWDSVYTLPSQLLCHRYQNSDGILDDEQTRMDSGAGWTLMDCDAEVVAAAVGDDGHRQCHRCELCVCDCLCNCPFANDRQALSQHHVINTKENRYKVGKQLRLIDALGSLGQSAAVSVPLESIRLDLLKQKFNSNTLVSQWISAHTEKESKPYLLKSLVQSVSEIFDLDISITNEDLENSVNHTRVLNGNNCILSTDDFQQSEDFKKLTSVSLDFRSLEKIDHVDQNYYEIISSVDSYPSDCFFRLDFAHKLYSIIHEEMYERTVDERSRGTAVDHSRSEVEQKLGENRFGERERAALELWESPLNSVTKVSLCELFNRCLEEYLVCASLDDTISSTCILRWLCLLCGLATHSPIGSHKSRPRVVIDELCIVRKELLGRLCSMNYDLIQKVPIRVWFSVLPQLVCRCSVDVVGPTICVPLIASLLMLVPHQTTWYIAQLWSSVRPAFRRAAKAILESVAVMQMILKKTPKATITNKAGKLIGAEQRTDDQGPVLRTPVTRARARADLCSTAISTTAMVSSAQATNALMGQGISGFSSEGGQSAGAVSGLPVSGVSLEHYLMTSVGTTVRVGDVWSKMTQFTDLLIQAAEDMKTMPGDCSVKLQYPNIYNFNFNRTILVPSRQNLWLLNKVVPKTYIQCWRQKFINRTCSTIASMYTSPSKVITSFPLPLVHQLGANSNAGFDHNSEIWLDSINNRMTVFRSKQKPKKISMIGSDGNIYQILLKFENRGDIRKDARVQELAHFINERLPNEITQNVTFIVLCLKELSGLIEWVPGTQTLKDSIGSCTTHTPLPGVGAAGGAEKVRLQFRDRPKQSEYHIVLRNYVEIGLMKNPPVLHQWYLKMFGHTASMWITARIHFIHTLAVWNCLGYILGLGDRHTENILLSSITGQVIHVDFDCLFDKGMTKLKIPEIVPFRLTPNLVTVCGCSFHALRNTMVQIMDAMTYTCSSGPHPRAPVGRAPVGRAPVGRAAIGRAAIGTGTGLRQGAWSTLDTPMAGSRGDDRLCMDILSILQSFVSDPSVEWDGETTLELLKQVQWKLQGKLNCSCPYTHLCQQNPKSDKYKIAIKCSRPDILPVWSHRKLSSDVFVDLLIASARDKLNLALMYFGWSPWI
ncbi:phosphatidylinositol 3- and 4-kinase [Gregarina niphandrodes]|uniref:Phosphatidylinositol 3- and 4-kinase n=1 Tax=Gregarina niphandrodes TaxID=110365 RepID=A0A023BB61_GRENI|nr:phosphatidylinositol 3- and 4-kinase [Gregarina niphandrodes]EZG79254.1 phosphatidylinositol 3- and 4-kinase [Gregarina niphandrodes]|eukprot:XP_011129101.1 phosphatidylinositol 3- and 4-kinase [Gregarina niphandrodes]